MADTAPPADNSAEADGSKGSARSKDEVALELMKFIAIATGYGKSSGSTGFSGKPTARTAEEHAAALLELFDRCRRSVGSA